MKSQIRKISLKHAKEHLIASETPWIFSGALHDSPKGISNGDFVQLYTTGGKYLAAGHFYNSSISLKILGYEEASEEELLEARIDVALALREKLGFLEGKKATAYRLIHAEADCIPGLIADLYGETLVLQAQTEGIARLLPLVTRLLTQKLSPTSIYIKNSNSPAELVYGEAKEVWINEKGANFFVDVEAGQKTGFFLDQRENRSTLAPYAKGKNVLNAFSYTGGFGIPALQAGASHLVSIDSSDRALSILSKNLEANFEKDFIEERHTSIKADYLKWQKNGELKNFDLVILDPPAFIKQRKAFEQGLRGYYSINLEAFKQMKAGSHLATFSCSQLLSKQDFRALIENAASEANRSIKIVRSFWACPSHPVIAAHPPTEYLKGLLVFIGG